MTINAIDITMQLGSGGSLVHLPQDIRAFPNAEGFGAAETVGGRGGSVYKVTNLNDSGAGSFRAAATASGARMVLFEVSGIINLIDELTISNPYITIAGQSSPGGILITGRTVLINTNDVIITHLRIRVGSHNMVEADAHDSLKIIGNSQPAWWPNPAYNVVIDHCSIGWGVDECFEVSLGATNITVSRCIIAQGLLDPHTESNHSMGFIYWGAQTVTDANTSLHHNYLAHNYARNPMISGSSIAPYPDILLDIVNNVVYNPYGGQTMMLYESAKTNIVHNYIRGGLDTSATAHEANLFTAPDPAESNIFMEGNIGPYRTSQSDPEWTCSIDWTTVIISEDYRTLTKWPSPTVTTTISSSTMADTLLTDVGATKPSLDSVDVAIIADFAAGTGTYVNDVTYPDDFPTFSTPAPPIDTNGDGIPDGWVRPSGIPSGYTNLEVYLFELGGYI